jgi:hypothetical protein
MVNEILMLHERGTMLSGIRREHHSAGSIMESTPSVLNSCSNQPVMRVARSIVIFDFNLDQVFPSISMREPAKCVRGIQRRLQST